MKDGYTEEAVNLKGLLTAAVTDARDADECGADADRTAWWLPAASAASSSQDLSTRAAAGPGTPI